MNFFKRAIRSVTRQKSKSLILFAVIFLLGNILAGSVIIQQATQNVEKTTKQQMGALATVEVDYNDEKIMKELEKNNYDYKPLTEKQMKQLGRSPYVKRFDYSVESGIQSRNLKGYTAKTKKKEMKEQSGDDSKGELPYFPLRGVQDPKLMDVALGKIKLVEGKSFTADDIKTGKPVIVMSKQLAKTNGFHLGDEVTLDNILRDAMGGPLDKSYDVKVTLIGIYEPVLTSAKTSDSKTDKGRQAERIESDKYNTIYSSNSVVTKLNSGYFELMKTETPDLYSQMISGIDESKLTVQYFTPVFQLKSVDAIGKFKSEMAPLLPKYYTVLASTDEFDKSAGQFSKLAAISKSVIVAAISLSIILILLVILLFMRDRKRELGIYLSLGDKKSTIMLQIMVEVLSIAIIALVLSLVTGKFLGSFASEAFLSNASKSSTSNQMMEMGSALSRLGTEFDTEKIANNYAVSFTPFYIVTYLLAGLGTVIVSVLLSTLYIFKLKPKKILLG